MTQPAAGEDVKACCAGAYSSDVAALLLGDSYHPGGTALTRRLAGALALSPGDRVLDVASGRGTTALLLSAGYQVRADGVDYSPASVASAREAAAVAGLGDRAVFTAGDAEQLPYPDGAFDAVICECALCTFPGPEQAAAEFARVLRPGGLVGIADVISDPERLPAELTGLAGRIACIAGARPLDGYAALLVGAGLRAEHAERHDSAIATMIDQIEARLNLLRMTAPGRLAAAGIDLAAAAPLLAAARAAVAAGTLGYALLTARKPAV